MHIYIAWIKEKFRKNPHLIKVTVITIVIIVAFFVTICGDDETGNISIEARDNVIENAEITEEVEEKITIIVDVGGAVNKPGIIELPEGARVYQAIEKAGGLSQNGDLNQINQAMLLNDQDKLYIPTIEESEEELAASNNSFSDAYISGGHSSFSNDGKVNINTASQEELESLSGIGPVTANKIIDYRQLNGKFDTIENLMEVSGIGEKTFAALKDKICI